MTIHIGLKDYSPINALISMVFNTSAGTFIFFYCLSERSANKSIVVWPTHKNKKIFLPVSVLCLFHEELFSELESDGLMQSRIPDLLGMESASGCSCSDWQQKFISVFWFTSISDIHDISSAIQFIEFTNLHLNEKNKGDSGKTAIAFIWEIFYRELSPAIFQYYSDKLFMDQARDS